MLYVAIVRDENSRMTVIGVFSSLVMALGTLEEKAGGTLDELWHDMDTRCSMYKETNHDSMEYMIYRREQDAIDVREMR
jgi:hypothetical protein